MNAMRGGPKRLLLALCAGLSLVSTTWADDEDTQVIVGRADADASGGWPLAVWVLDGDRSHFIVRAPHEQLAAPPGRTWEAMDAASLLDLERYGAPRLVLQQDYDACSTTLLWERPLGSRRIIHVAPERDELQTPACGAASCSGQAWRISLEAGPVLPLKALMPGLSARQPEWLVLYVIGPDEALRLEGLPMLDVPAPWRLDASRLFDLPSDAIVRFPAIHAAMLEHAAARQGLAQASVLMRSDMQTTVQPLRLSRLWNGSPEHREALGLAVPTVQGHYIVRLLLRLHPDDRPAELRLQPAPRRSIEAFRTLHAGKPLGQSADSCRRSLATMDCETACTERIDELRKSYVSRNGVKGALHDTDSETLMQQCRPACEAQRHNAAASVELHLDAVPQRQQEAWHWVEEMTGRSAASWQTR